MSALLSIALVFALPAASTATPVATKRAQAIAAKAQVDALDEKLEIASEDYNEANSAYRAVTAQVRTTEKRLSTLTAQQARLQTHLHERVGGMYRTGPLGFLGLLLGATSFEEFATAWDLLQDLNAADAETVAELKATRAALAEARAVLKSQQATAKKERDTMRAREQAIRTQLAERGRLLSGLEAEVRQLEEEAAEAQARAAALWVAPIVEGGGNPSTLPRSGVVAVAMSKLGSPYQWGADGPDSFDCSGFTMWVFRQVGVSLPHSSRGQYSCGERVSRANLRPGDLVFFGRSRIHHVGIYVGGNRFIHAPNTGDVVKLSSLDRSDYVGAVRP